MFKFIFLIGLIVFTKTQVLNLPTINNNSVSSSTWSFMIPYLTSAGNYTSFIDIVQSNCLTTFYQYTNITNGQSLRTCIIRLRNQRINKCLSLEAVIKYDVTGIITINLPNKNIQWTATSGDGISLGVNATLSDTNLRYYGLIENETSYNCV